MSKIAKSIAIIGLALILTGCGDSLMEKSIEQAEKAIESRDYEKALASLEKALNVLVVLIVKVIVRNAK